MNEKIKETKKDEIEKEIVDYIKGHRPQYKTCVLATSKDNIPRATPVMYYQEDLIIWISTEKRKNGKVENIISNPKVSLAIFDPVDSDYGWDDTRGLQLWGDAEIITYKENEPEFNHAWEIADSEGALKAFGREVPLEIVKNNLIYIKVKPERISFVDSKKQRGYKVIWNRD
jgi:general stress protein 26